MLDKCQGQNLLEIARESLQATLGAHNKKLTNLMVINAIGIVEREIASQEQLAFCSENIGKASGNLAKSDLCSRIRSGHFDDDSRLYDALLDCAKLNARIFKPGSSK
ncbi:DUF6285 domain-containing protein [Ruegeria arenilitoris]|uniref:DUF6285 domain-containing protein n=1 Tax=Ruegeria arenilitoris TaxID=1173585 RepID=UPI001481746C|nr:DUF6285 domain-containing protein [Ruegeria arenilitoris]